MTSYYKYYNDPVARLRAAKLAAALAEAEHLAGVYDIDMAVYSANAALAVGDIVGAAHRAADAAECVAGMVECGEYDANGAEYAIGLGLWRASNAVLAAAGGRA